MKNLFNKFVPFCFYVQIYCFTILLQFGNRL